MFGEQFTAESVQCRLHGCGLHEDIGAVCAFFHHALYASDLSLDTVQTVYQLFILLGGAVLFLMAAGAVAAALFGFLFGFIQLFRTSFPFLFTATLYTPEGYLSIDLTKS